MLPLFLIWRSRMSALHVVPLFLTAKSREELVVRMIENNIKERTTYKYFDIQQNGKVHVAWYLADAGKFIKLKIEKELDIPMQSKERANGVKKGDRR